MLQEIMKMTDIRFENADADYECNASLHFKDCLDDYWLDFSAEQKKAIEKAIANNWQIKKGERCRRYTWDKGGIEECECVEIPEMAEICSEFDMWME